MNTERSVNYIYVMLFVQCDITKVEYYYQHIRQSDSIPEAFWVSACWALLPVLVGDLTVSIWLAHRQLLPLGVAPEKCPDKRHYVFSNKRFIFFSFIIHKKYFHIFNCSYSYDKDYCTQNVGWIKRLTSFLTSLLLYTLYDFKEYFWQAQFKVPALNP